VRAEARSLGFAAAGVTNASRLSEGKRLREWLALGYQAGMRWMARPEIREDPAALLGGARSVVVVGWSIRGPAASPGPGEGRLARFAALPDYHDRIRTALLALLERLRAVVPCRGAVAVDSSPVLERALAGRAGLGWAGKSSCLVSADHGPWLLLGELVLDLDLAPDVPGVPQCGACDRCSVACPTGAIVSPGLVDAGRCVAYLTVEHRGGIPRELRVRVGRWLFGCDACQEACPWPRVEPTCGVSTSVETPQCAPPAAAAAGFLGLDEAGFKAAYAGTALMRTGRARMARNAAVVLGNLGDPAAVPALTAALRDPDPVVRGHAGWALGRLKGRAPGAAETLAAAARTETDPAVLEELAAAAA